MIGLMYNLIYKANPHHCQTHSAQAKALPLEGASALGNCWAEQQLLLSCANNAIKLAW